jgi:multiple sugar transport system permease protein
MKKKSFGWTALIYVGLALWLMLASLPIVWTAIISLRQYVDAFSIPIKWIAPVTFENYTSLWIDKQFYKNFFNTVIVTLGTVTISLTVGCLAGCLIPPCCPRFT